MSVLSDIFAEEPQHEEERPSRSTFRTVQTMNRLAVMICLSLSATACGESNRLPLPTQPSAPVQPSNPIPPPPDQTVRTIAAGDVVRETLSSWSDRRFQLTAPQDGMLVVKLSWDAYYWDTLLLLRIEDTNVPSGPASFSPIISRARVAAGRTYYLAVGFLAVGHAPITDFTLSTVVD